MSPLAIFVFVVVVFCAGMFAGAYLQSQWKDNDVA